jgi:hypothetical protein
MVDAGPGVAWVVVSEKRQRQQQRRARRRAVRRPRPQDAAGRSGGRPPGEGDLEQQLAELAEIAVRGAHEPTDALEAEYGASALLGALNDRPGVDLEIRARFRADLVRAIEAIGDSDALATLRALSAVGTEAERGRARAAAQRLAAQSVEEPSWAAVVGAAAPIAAALQYEECFDDGVSVIVEFEVEDGVRETLGVYIDHNLGGLVKDVFLAGPLSEVRARLSVTAPNGERLMVRELDLAEARARIAAALDRLDHTYDPPVDEDVWGLRALIDARLDLLPGGGELGAEDDEVSASERAQILHAFLASPHGERWRGNDDAEDVVATAIDFGVDYNHGGPLRWSPVVVEIFMTGWVTRKVIREPAFFTLLPDVLVDWVAYAGGRRGVPAPALREATDAVAAYRDEMLGAIDDPEAWGPAKAFAVAAQRAGVDLSDPTAVEEFVERYNQYL